MTLAEDADLVRELNGMRPLDHLWCSVAFEATKYYLLNTCDDPNEGMLAFMILGAFERDDDAVIITDELVREQLNVPGMLNHRLLQYLNEYENLATDDEKACMSSMKRELERSRTRM